MPTYVGQLNLRFSLVAGERVVYLSLAVELEQLTLLYFVFLEPMPELTAEFHVLSGSLH
ncbi:hypothetical protein D9M71_722770 [compost metagenome]